MRYTDLKSGMKVIASKTLRNNIGDTYKEGYEFLVVDNPDDGTILFADKDRVEEMGVDGALNNHCGTWFYFNYGCGRDNTDVQFIQTNWPLDKSEVDAIITPQDTQKEEAVNVTKVKQARIKPIYVVQDADGETIVTTREREFARMVKKECGGKADGVKIVQYVAVKEIR